MRLGLLTFKPKLKDSGGQIHSSVIGSKMKANQYTVHALFIYLFSPNVSWHWIICSVGINYERGVFSLATPWDTYLDL